MKKKKRIRELLAIVCIVLISAYSCTQKPEMDNDAPTDSHTPIVGHHNVWVDSVAINDETETYQPFASKPYIDFTTDTESGFIEGDYAGHQIGFPITSYNINVPLLPNTYANEEHIEVFKEALEDNKQLYFYLRYYVEPYQYYYWLHLELLGPNQYYSQLQYLLKKEVNFNPATDRRIKYEIKIQLTEQMINRMDNENMTTYHEGLFHMRGGNITIEGAYITIEDE